MREVAVPETNHIENRSSPLAIGSPEFRTLGYQLIDRISGFMDSLPERPVSGVQKD
jgi:hypothetical protein